MYTNWDTKACGNGVWRKNQILDDSALFTVSVLVFFSVRSPECRWSHAECSLRTATFCLCKVFRSMEIKTVAFTDRFSGLPQWIGVEYWLHESVSLIEPLANRSATLHENCLVGSAFSNDCRAKETKIGWLISELTEFSLDSFTSFVLREWIGLDFLTCRTDFNISSRLDFAESISFCSSIQLNIILKFWSSQTVTVDAGYRFFFYDRHFLWIIW